MSLIREYIPDARLHEVDRVAVAADPERAYATARHLEMTRSPLVRWLFALRDLPHGLGAVLHPPRIGIDEIAASPSGFHILRDVPGRGVVLGAIGKMWQ